MYKADKLEKQNGQWAVRMRRSQDRKLYWMNVWIEGNDVGVDWNQDIFHTDDPEDRHRSKVQDSCSEFSDASSEAIGYLEKAGEIKQDEHGDWHKADKA